MFNARLLALAVIALCAGTTSVCDGQSDSVMVARVTPRWSTGSVSFQMGTATLGLDDINRTLTSNDRPAFATNVSTIGFAAHARFGRLVLGGAGETALPQRKESAGWINKALFSSAMLDLGVALVDNGRLLVYPQGSIGLRRSALQIEKDGDFSYESGVRDPARGMTVSTLGAMASYGLAAEMHFNSRAMGAFSLGVRAGYATLLGNASVRAGESQVTDAPRERGGQYLRLTVGRPIGKRSDALSSLSSLVLPFVTR